MTDEPLRSRGRYALKQTTRTARAVVDEIEHRVEIDTHGHDDSAAEHALNDIGRVHLRTSEPLVVDPYARNRATGSFILMDEASNETVGAGMVVASR